MKLTKDDVGVYVTGSTLHSPTEQAFKIFYLAIGLGFKMEARLVKQLQDKYDEGELTYDDYDEIEYTLEDAIFYLNKNCVEDNLAFTFVDTDFVLISGEGF